MSASLMTDDGTDAEPPVCSVPCYDTSYAALSPAAALRLLRCEAYAEAWELFLLRFAFDGPMQSNFYLLLLQRLTKGDQLDATNTEMANPALDFFSAELADFTEEFANALASSDPNKRIEAFISYASMLELLHELGTELAMLKPNTMPRRFVPTDLVVNAALRLRHEMIVNPAHSVSDVITLHGT